jgi:hypothetical protein
MANFNYFQSFTYKQIKQKKMQYPIMFDFTTLKESEKVRIM